MADELFGSQEEAVGKVIKLSGLPFTIVGTFRERVDTFGQSEVVDYTMLIPYTVSRYFTDTPTVKQIYFSVADPAMVAPATDQIRRVIQSRHRAESVYNVMNLTQLVTLAEKTANALTLVLLLVAAVVLLVSGIGIMNIMLATVSSRIREIGIRKALGATNREIRFQFLAEAMTDLAGRRLHRRGHRPGDSLLGTLSDGVPHSHLRLVGDCRDRSVVAGRSNFRNRARHTRGQAGSGGEFEVRVKQPLARSLSALQLKPRTLHSVSRNLPPL